MRTPPGILVVDDSLARGAIVTSLRNAGYRVTSAGTFEQATNIISSDPPDVLITELRLGAFNGLHLVIRSQAADSAIVSIIHTAFPDPVLETEAHLLGAEFLIRPVDTALLLKVIARRLGPTFERRVSPRKPLSGRLEANVADARASLVDLSYEGFRVELPSGEIPAPFELHLPSSGLSVKAQVVWARRPSTQGGALLCGATVSEMDAHTTPAWRRIVDAV